MISLSPVTAAWPRPRATWRCSALGSSIPLPLQPRRTTLLLVRSSSSSSTDSSPPSPSTSPFPTPSSTIPTTPSFPPPTFPASFGSNQTLPLDPAISHRLSLIMTHFAPLTSIQFSFAYGSGVFPQSQSQSAPQQTLHQPLSSPPSSKAQGKKMVDLIMAVRYLDQWHAVNMERNPKHYSAVARWLGSAMAARVTKWGAGLWYNPYVPMGDEMVKYGVMDIDTLCKDLLDWDTLYVSGRMHKPVGLITTTSRIRLAQQVNLTSALRVSLLLLPSHFTEIQLYTRIASLSYTGDFRMSVPGGENKDKVRNIVSGQRLLFRRLYAGLIRSLGCVGVRKGRGEERFVMEQDTSIPTRASHASQLPLNLRSKIQSHYLSRPSAHPSFLKLSLSKNIETGTRLPSHLSPSPSSPSSTTSSSSPPSTTSTTQKDKEAVSAAEEASHQEFWRAVVVQGDFEEVLQRKIAEIVKGPAWAQSVKGVWTAGFRRSVRYVGAKVGKYFEGRRARAEEMSAGAHHGDDFLKGNAKEDGKESDKK